MMMKYERLGEVKRDIFSDLRDSGFDYLGVNKSTRDQLQPVVDKAKNLLPKGGVPADPGAGNYTEQVITAVKSVNPMYIALGVVLIGAAIYFGRK